MNNKLATSKLFPKFIRELFILLMIYITRTICTAFLCQQISGV